MQKMTDAYIRNLKGADKMREILVDECLYLRITMRKNGKTKKKWFLRYSDGTGKQFRFTFGEYPDMGLAEAKVKAVELLKRARQGVTLAEQAKQGKDIATFKEMSESWHARKKEGWVDGHALRQWERLSTVNRVFGAKDVNAVTMDDIIAVIGLKTSAGNLDSARRTLSLIRSVLEYADTLNRLDDNRILVRIDSFRKTLAAPRKDRHLYVELADDEIGKLLADIEIESTKWKPETGTALKLAPYLIVRPKELCGARWEEFDMENAEWKIPTERMKMGREHIVPLPTQAIGLLEELKKLTGNGEHLFPAYSKDKSHIGTEALIRALRRMGYSSSRQKQGTFFTTHGFRGMASTILYQKLHFPGHLIELQLAHVDENKVRAAYNRINSRSWLDERREMLQTYADYIENLKISVLDRGQK